MSDHFSLNAKQVIFIVLIVSPLVSFCNMKALLLLWFIFLVLVHHVLEWKMKNTSEGSLLNLRCESFIVHFHTFSVAQIMYELKDVILNRQDKAALATMVKKTIYYEQFKATPAEQHSFIYTQQYAAEQ